ncbi:MAG TPA: hypothetical protein VHE30_17470, partial [Polyangiaceae bacterium]|nr:hypothetical protein [Polyangiaceae bacterium]
IRMEDQASAQPVQQPVTPPPPATAPPPPAAEPAPSGGKRSLVPLFVAGGGTVVGVVGAVLLASGLGDVSDAEKLCPVHDKCTSQSVIDQGNSGRSRAQIGGIVLGVGAAALVGGVIWYGVQSPSQTAKAPRGFLAHVTPELGPGFAGASFAGRF